MTPDNALLLSGVLTISSSFLLVVCVCIVCKRNKMATIARVPAAGAPLPAVPLSDQTATLESKRMANLWRHTNPITLFDWSDNPSLMSEALEMGWTAFAFNYSCSIAGQNPCKFCTRCLMGEAFKPQTTWQIGPGSEFMQIIRLNPRMIWRKGGFAPVQAMHSALPLPGPPLGHGSFPQEGYFEITIIREGSENPSLLREVSFSENEEIELMSKQSRSDQYAISGFDRTIVDGFQTNRVVDETLTPSQQIRMNEDKVLGIGLSSGGAPPFRMPGLDYGSIGLYSNGQLLYNGNNCSNRLEVHPEKKWEAAVCNTLGCGFLPRSQKIYFTVNGDFLGEVTCENPEFAHPLHATIAANYDVTVHVNFGQCAFEFIPSNSQRVADPSSFRPKQRSTRAGSVYDSGDLFSVDGESDLFEIVLDRIASNQH